MDEEGRLSPPVGSSDHVRATAQAPVTLVEYGDFECPYCGEAYPIVRELERRIGERLRIVWRNFPLANIHPHATEAARAAEAASEQRKFWEMHDQLFEHQDRLERADLDVYAERIGLDLAPFGADLASHAIADRVRGHFRSGVRSGVNGTPTFFINGRRHDGGYSLRELLDAIDRAAASEELGDAERQSFAR
jgi:protein-disulfide isomerase